jgi:hypothetical protein
MPKSTCMADRGNRRIQVFDSDGNFLRQMIIEVPVNPEARPAIGNKPTHPTGAQKPGSPWAICVTPPPHQVLYSSDAFPGRIYKLSPDGKVHGMLGQPFRLSDVPSFNLWGSRVPCGRAAAAPMRTSASPCIPIFM